MFRKFFRSIKVAFFLSIRLILRGNKGISSLTVFMIALIYLNLLFVPSLIQGVSNQINNQLIETISSNITIKSSDNKTPIDNTDQFLNSIRNTENISATTSRMRAGTEIASKNNSTVINVEAIDPNSDSQVFINSQKIIEGNYLGQNDKDGILLGIQVAGADRTDLTFYASSLKTVHAGDTVSVTLINGQKKDFVVRGIFKDDFVLADNAAFITQNALNNLIPTTKNKSTSIYVKTKNIGNEDSTISKLQSIRNDLKYDKWQSLQGVIKDQLDTFTLVNNILRMISLLVASVTIFIITYVDLVNKRKQIGIERAIGIKSTAIVLSYLLKAIYYSIAAVLLGSLLYLYLIVPIVIAHPFHFPNGLVTLAIDSNMMINDGISIVIVGMISALIPSISTIRMKILDAIWGN